MIVLAIDGWDKSYGVKAEIELCQKLSIPVKYLNPSHLEYDVELDALLKDDAQECSRDRAFLSASSLR
jgi:hypothetical protein